MTEPRAHETLGTVLRAARAARGLSLRDVERRTGIRNAHLSQIETDTIAKPEMAILWDLASLYDVDFGRLLALAGHASGAETSGSQRRRTTVALRALSQLTPGDQTEALRFMAELKARRDRGEPAPETAAKARQERGEPAPETAAEARQERGEPAPNAERKARRSRG
jgi:HTH-type transcriptional regulator, competence development regulator